MFRLDEKNGSQIPCNMRGIPIKPFNPKITGRFNYDDRKTAIIKTRANLSPVELPAELKPNFKRIYAPCIRKLEGYA